MRREDFIFTIYKSQNYSLQEFTIRMEPGMQYAYNMYDVTTTTTNNSQYNKLYTHNIHIMNFTLTVLI